MSATYADQVDVLYSNRGKVKAYSSSEEQYLSGAVTSTNGSIGIAQTGTGTSAKVNIYANFGTSASTVCVGNDSRLSNARTPTAHASTHKGGGSDAIDVATQSVNGLMSAADKLKLDSTSSTPTASYIPVANGRGKLTAWIDAATQSIPGTMSAADKTKLDSTSATPTAGYIPVADGSGKLNGWVDGRQVNTETITSGSAYFTTFATGWFSGPTVTFTSGGTRFNVIAQATVTADTAYSNLCALAIVADTGTSASTIRGTSSIGILKGSYNGFVNSTAFGNVIVYSTITTVANFTLSTGQVTVGANMYQDQASPCRVPSGSLKVYVDVYK